MYNNSINPDALKPQQGFGELLLKNCPVALLTTPFIIGIAFQYYFKIHIAVWFILCVILFCLVFVRKVWLRAAYAIIVVVITFFCFGAARYAFYAHPAACDIRNIIADETYAHIKAKVITRPIASLPQQWRFAGSYPVSQSISFYAKILEIKTAAGPQKCTGKIKFYIPQSSADFRPGDLFQAFCNIRRFASASNPGQFDAKKYMEQNNVYFAAHLKNMQGVQIIPGKTPAAAKIFSLMQSFACKALIGDEPPDQTDAMLSALVLGIRQNIDNETMQAFKHTGLAHYISLSGMHVAILLAAVWRAGRFICLKNMGRTILCAVFLILFLIVVPPRPAAVRAIFVGLVFCAGNLFQRKIHPLNSLSLAGLLWCLIAPADVFNVGFELSYAGVMGILLLQKHISKIMLNMTYGKFKKTIDSFATGIAAWLPIAPVILLNFNYINLLSAFWTVLTMPIVGAIMCLGLVKIIISILLPGVSAVLAWPVAAATDLFIFTVRFFASVDPTYILIGEVPMWFVIIWYIAIGFAVWPMRKYLPYRPVIIAASFFLIFFCLTGIQYAHRHPQNPRLTVLDVGSGAAAVVSTGFGDDKHFIFDAGSRSIANIGDKIVNPYLDRKAIKKLDAIIISHNHSDHFNGVPEIIARRKVAGIYTSELTLSNFETSGTGKKLLDYPAAKNLKISPVCSFISRFQSQSKIQNLKSKIDVLWPLPAAEPDSLDKYNENEKSLVMLLELAGRKILFTSDISPRVQNELLTVYPGLKADVLFLPHHGSPLSLSQDFINAVDPSVCIASGRTEKKPVEPAADNRLYYTTSVHGAITVSINRDGQIKTTPTTQKFP